MAATSRVCLRRGDGQRMTKINVTVKREGNITPGRFRLAARRGLGKILELARQVAIEKAPGFTGRLKGGRGGYGGITARIEEKVKKYLGILGATARDPRTGHDYAPDVHEGTGIYGPRHARIFPKKAKVLVWPKLAWTPWPRDAAAWKMFRHKFIFARSTKGQPPQPFLQWGVDAASKQAESIFDREIENLDK